LVEPCGEIREQAAVYRYVNEYEYEYGTSS
jgi:hypothetical protein